MFESFADFKKTGKFNQNTSTEQPEIDVEAIQKLPTPEKPILVLYLGAGRGPLIMRTLKAAEKARVPVRLICVEKNPNAVITLRNLIHDKGISDRVQLFSGDMRFL